jgi:hypothetical protein
LQNKYFAKKITKTDVEILKIFTCRCFATRKIRRLKKATKEKHINNWLKTTQE